MATPLAPDVGAGDGGAPPAAPPPEEEGGEAAAKSSPPTPELQTSQPSAANPAGDILNFQADLFTGRFSYSVPIVVPPGRQGSQPGIALSYDSQGANGWCGVGWMLDVGYIQRDTRYGVPIKWSGTMPTNQYDDAKGFVFSSGGVGARLVNIGGNEFRAEVDGAFLKFTYVTNGTDN